jgi:hypothetical protein
MYHFLRPQPDWWLVRLYADDAAPSGWMEAAYLDGHRLFEDEDEEGQPATVAVVRGQDQVRELLCLMEALGVSGSLEYLP